jgi:medium-chain acyl-[acyl-carrier-protein] hydrolase
MVNMREGSQNDPQQRWILRPAPRPAATLRLFCFPYAGIGASIFRSWAPEFPPHVELCLIQPPGREGRFTEPAFHDLSAMADSAAQGIAKHLSTPFMMFGHSLGALVSFEVVRRLRRQGLPLPLHLFVSAHRAPHVPNPHAPLRHLADAEFIERVSREYDGIPRAVLENPDLVELMLPSLRADFTAFETYQWTDEAPLQLPISAFGGRTDRRVSEAELDGWRGRTTGSFRLEMFDGDHFFLQSRRDELIASIRRDLNQSMSAGAVR